MSGDLVLFALDGAFVLLILGAFVLFEVGAFVLFMDGAFVDFSDLVWRNRSSNYRQ
jgi:hypothetical protein